MSKAGLWAIAGAIPVLSLGLLAKQATGDSQVVLTVLQGGFLVSQLAALGIYAKQVFSE